MNAWECCLCCYPYDEGSSEDGRRCLVKAIVGERRHKSEEGTNGDPKEYGGENDSSDSVACCLELHERAQPSSSKSELKRYRGVFYNTVEAPLLGPVEFLLSGVAFVCNRTSAVTEIEVDPPFHEERGGGGGSEADDWTIVSGGG